MKSGFKGLESEEEPIQPVASSDQLSRSLEVIDYHGILPGVRTRGLIPGVSHLHPHHPVVGGLEGRVEHDDLARRVGARHDGGHEHPAQHHFVIDDHREVAGEPPAHGLQSLGALAREGQLVARGVVESNVRA